MRFITKYPLRITVPIFLFVAGIIISVYSMIHGLRVADAEAENSGMTFVMHDMSELQGIVNSFLQEGNVEATKLAIANIGSTPNTEFLLLADENNTVLHATRVEFPGLPIQQAVPGIDADLINNAKKTMSGKIMISKNRDSISAYYPVVIGARQDELRPSRVGILFTKYDLTYLKAARRYEIEHQAWQFVSLYSLLFLSLGIILYYALTKRLLGLVAATKRFAAGDTSARSGLQGKDEIAQIGKAFDNMVQKILIDQEVLRASEERFHAMFEQAGDGVFILDTNGKIILINETFALMHGLTTEEMLRRGLEGLDMEGTAPVPERLRRIMAGETLTFEVEHYHKDGHTFPLSVTTNLISSGNEQLIMAVHRDISQRKRAEDEIRLNEARLTSLLKISQHKAESIQELLDFALDEAIKLTASKIGYIYYYNDQKKEFTLNTWSKDVMEECSIAEPQAIYQLDKTGIWGEAIRQAKPIMINDYQAPHPLKKGYPEGHAPLYNFLTLPIFNADRIVAVVAVANKQTDYDESDIRQLTLMMDSVWRIADRKRAELDLIASEQSLRKAVSATIQVLVSTVEARDPYTSGHQVRSADLARAIATEMGLPQEKIDAIRMAGSIHDIGKLSIPAEILSKPTKLSDLEFSLIKEHSRKGFEMLKDVESPWPLAEIVLQHHERMDGSGYPRNLKGEEILMEARILAVADVIEAMASHRPYRPGLGIDAALTEIEKNRGTIYDKTVADACLKLFREKGFQLEGA